MSANFHPSFYAQVVVTLLLLTGIKALDMLVVEVLPLVSYVKCVDVWFGACYAFIVLALLHSLIVHCREAGASDEPRKRRGSGGRCRPLLTHNCLARILFPACFLLFIVIFSVLYSL